jgi:hypothetical protein
MNNEIWSSDSKHLLDIIVEKKMHPRLVILNLMIVRLSNNLSGNFETSANYLQNEMCTF